MAFQTKKTVIYLMFVSGTVYFFYLNYTSALLCWERRTEKMKTGMGMTKMSGTGMTKTEMTKAEMTKAEMTKTGMTNGIETGWGLLVDESCLLHPS
jgi:hypothetical protein